MWIREIVVAAHYFRSGQNFRFFGRVQKNKLDIFQTLTNMAWDLLHVRDLEQSVTARTKRGVRYFVPSLLTSDKGLIEVIDLFPVKAIFSDEISKQFIPFYGVDLVEILRNEFGIEDEMLHRFFGEDAVQRRRTRINEARSNLRDSICKLEADLAKAARIDIHKATPSDIHSSEW